MVDLVIAQVDQEGLVALRDHVVGEVAAEAAVHDGDGQVLRRQHAEGLRVAHEEGAEVQQDGHALSGRRGRLHSARRGEVLGRPHRLHAVD